MGEIARQWNLSPPAHGQCHHIVLGSSLSWPCSLSNGPTGPLTPSPSGLGRDGGGKGGGRFNTKLRGSFFYKRAILKWKEQPGSVEADPIIQYLKDIWTGT